MDKQEATQVLSDFISFNKKDIAELGRDFPEVSDIFGNILLELDKKYASGTLKKSQFTSAVSHVAEKELFSIGDLFRDISVSGDPNVGTIFRVVTVTENQDGNELVRLINVKSGSEEDYEKYALDRWITNKLFVPVTQEQLGAEQTTAQTNLRPKDLVGKTYVMIDKKGKEGRYVLEGMERTSSINYRYKTKNKNGDSAILNVRKGNMDALLKGETLKGGSYILELNISKNSQTLTKQAFKIGDQVVVSDEGKVYPNYTKPDTTINTGTAGTIMQDVNNLDVPSLRNKPLPVYKVGSGNVMFYIGEDGISKVSGGFVGAGKDLFEVGDSFIAKGVKEVYKITGIDSDTNKYIISWTDQSGMPKSVTTNDYTKEYINSLFKTGAWVKVNLKAPLKNISPSVTTKITTAIPASNWTPDWKTKGKRNSPQRSSNTEGELGMGNDGKLYERKRGKNGVLSWKTTPANQFHPTVMAQLSSDDLKIMADQIKYAMESFSSGDDEWIEFKRILESIEKEYSTR